MSTTVRRWAGSLVGFGRAAGRRIAAVTGPVRRHRGTRRTGRAVVILVATLAGLVGGMLLAGPSSGDVGPFEAKFALTPAWSGGTDVQLPPLGAVWFDSHYGPVRLTVRLDSLDQNRTLALASSPDALAEASRTVVDDVRSGIIHAVIRHVVAGLLGALLVAVFVLRTPRRVAVSAGLAVAVMAATATVAVTTFRPESVEEPTYRGLLTNAPAVIGDAQEITSQFGRYRDQLQRLVNNVSKLYGTVSTLPAYQPTAGTVRVLHISDLHLNPVAWPLVTAVVRQYAIDVVIDTGDINDWGSPPESAYVDAIGDLGVPYVYVQGNHDSQLTATAVARQPNAVVLDDQIATVNGLTIAGIGDPRFTPDKRDADAEEPDADPVRESGRQLATTVTAAGVPVHLALVHDPVAAEPLNGVVPLVLAGHHHERKVSTMEQLPDRPATRLMVQGSTGGAGLRGLENEEPTSLQMSILYFGPQQALGAYDEITIGGTGRTDVTIQRKILDPEDQPQPSPSGTPSSSPR
ncbi:metallophosphoesterase family protein [Solwaraspora sp. WMMD1047]|uniref:metallophosphoesterase family protein n=1 Tax=Solwaraspora sp. WMMD1047 TaxID=3016102 RepID=UPI002416D7D2|nr:metallophosphoesterase [Solwaraspora sp. WMMD1047]MDG4833823.1 metallophosphoesterase family protein [Solwaraspora sp. WMMD1047]